MNSDTRSYVDGLIDGFLLALSLLWVCFVFMGYK